MLRWGPMFVAATGGSSGTDRVLNSLTSAYGLAERCTMRNLQRLTSAITRVSSYVARANAGNLIPDKETLMAGAELVREGARVQKTSRPRSREGTPAGV